MESLRDQRPATALELTGFDVMGFAFSGGAFLVALVTVLTVQPFFRPERFGGTPPALTVLCLKAWFPLALATAPALLVTVGLVARAPREVRIVLAVVAILMSLALPVVLALGLGDLLSPDASRESTSTRPAA